MPRRRTLLVTVTLAVVVASVTLSGASSPPARASGCITGGQLDEYWPYQHHNPSYGTPAPACFTWTDLTNGSQWEVCEWNGGAGSSTGTGSSLAYNETNASHTSSIWNDSDGDAQENDLIYHYCGASPSLNVEMEAPGTTCPTANYKDRNADFSVGVYLRELYCGSNSSKDSIGCTWTTSYGCIVNAGAYVPTQYGGPCTSGISSCQSQMTTAFSNACTHIGTAGDTIGVYGGYPLSYSDPTYGDIATIIAGWINQDLNGSCFVLCCVVDGTAKEQTTQTPPLHAKREGS